MLALPEDMIGISFTNSGPLVAPTHGRKALLGTNPIAVAVPAGRNQPYVLDMATSIVPIGRITVYKKNGKPIPAGWGIDREGNVTENPIEVLEGGALMPLGGLAGAGFGERVLGPAVSGAANTGHFFAALRIDAFRDPADFAADMNTLLGALRDSPKAAGEERIYIHGEKEFEKADRALVEGVALSEVAVKSLIQAGKQAGIPFDLVPLRID